MTFYHYLLFIPLLLTSLCADKIDFKFHSQKTQNANVILITAKSKENHNLKAILNEKEVLFNKHPFKKETFYALVPFHYFMKAKQHQVVLTYTLNEKDYFEGFDIELVEGDFEKEIIKVNNSKVSLSQKNKQRSSKEYKEAIKVYNTVTPTNYWYKDFIYPIHSKITSAFGTKRVYNDTIKSYHTGIDFKAKMNTDVYASNNGVVKVSSNRFYAGNSIIIDHGQGIYTCYFHLNKMFVDIGDFVQQGDLIGLSGNTGRTTGPHLHFATFVNGTQINPMNLLSLLNNLNN